MIEIAAIYIEGLAQIRQRRIDILGAEPHTRS